jgi:Ni,Fe-hydrogenase I large subunit
MMHFDMMPPAANLMAVAHYLEALDWQREVIKIHAILGSKNPHPQTYLVGGMAIPLDPNSPAALNADKLALQRQLLVTAKTFVDEVYVPDVLAVAPFYKEWAGLGAGVGNYLAYGDYPTDTSGDQEGCDGERGRARLRLAGSRAPHALDQRAVDPCPVRDRVLHRQPGARRIGVPHGLGARDSPHHGVRVHREPGAQDVLGLRRQCVGLVA